MNLTSGIIIARSLGPNGKGSMAILLSSVVILSAICNLGLPNSAIYHVKKKLLSAGQAIFTCSFIYVLGSIIVGTVFYAFREQFSLLLFKQNQLPGFFYVFILANIPLELFCQFCNTFALGMGQSKFYSYLISIKSTLNLAATILVLTIYGYGINSLLFITLALNSLHALVHIIHLSNTYSKFDFRLSQTSLKQLLSFGIRPYPGALSALLFKRTDNFVIAAYLNLDAAGIYSIALSFYNMFLSIPRSFGSLLMGESAKRSNEHSANLSKAALHNTLWLMTLLYPLAVLAFAYLIPYVYGSRFADASIPTIFIGASAVLTGSFGILGIFLISQGKPGTSSLITIAGGLISLVFTLIFTPSLGLAGPAISKLLGAIIFALLLTTIFKRHSSIRRLNLLQSPLPSWISRLRRTQ
ncbi:oligosaccharide flippase family protein [Puniceicoccaceae bacterium K14]|nr:oligosaccharide flippase family protein [Puniceicoccaceae bacterium K14]